MIGGKPDKDSDEKRFNETLKRMLKTPPKPHEKKEEGEYLADHKPLRPLDKDR